MLIDYLKWGPELFLGVCGEAIVDILRGACLLRKLLILIVVLLVDDS